MSFYTNRYANIKSVIINTLKEDVGIKDITTDSVIPKNRYAKAVILAKEPCVVCGLGVAGAVFKQQDKEVKFTPCVKDGDFVKKGKIIARVCGEARSILTAERVALNFLSHLCGISTKTREFVQKVKPYKAKIMDTRKTIPGLRELEKYAVRVGGGYNHRLRLDEMVLIKDNHIKIINPKSQILPQKLADSPIILANPNPKQIPISKSQFQSLRDVIEQIRNTIKAVKIEVEVKNLKEFREVLNAKLDIIMLDNMSIKDIKKAVRINKLWTVDYGRCTKIEASGRITLNNVKKVASTGVDMISIGELTHSVESVDISLEIL